MYSNIMTLSRALSTCMCILNTDLLTYMHMYASPQTSQSSTMSYLF